MSAPVQSTHSMTTRSKAGIFKPKHKADLAHVEHNALCATLFASPDPKGFKSAAKHAHWMEAMQKELTALHNNDTWTLVPRPKNQNVVGSKWLFCTKFCSDGSIERHKARLVAQGFSQILGLDYSHTFSPNGFTYSRSDPTLIVFIHESCIMHLVVYADDLILTENQDRIMVSFISRLDHEFAIKDLGELNYFLRLEATRTSEGLFLS
uniref:Putative ribonuclease H-like domain-containing protein n=1 Tax=Tanacetum cinerariifolium TaxID=118510 RepID=A0A6L2LYG9_TANCI|nr:putative ribonuclease H-like domain-containing protein [Tanacetum cinerariifolium]